MVWPEPLILIYPRWRIDAAHLPDYLPVLAAAACSVVFWRARKSRGRAAFFAWSVFVVSLFPLLGFFDVAYFAHSFVADHFQYLACMGPLALVGSGIAVAAEARKRESVIAGVGVLLLVLAFLTWHQSAPYADAQRLYETTLAKNPASWMAHNNLGNLVLQKNEVERALREFRAALSIKENYAEAQNNLGNTLLQTGRVDEAITHLQRALEVRPTFSDAENNLANALI